MSFNPRALNERTLKGFVDRWLRAQRAKPCPKPDQWPPSRAACQEDIAQLLGFSNWHEAISAIRKLQHQEPSAPSLSDFYPQPINTTAEVMSFLNWAYDHWMLGLELRQGAPIFCQSTPVTPYSLTDHQLSLFREFCLADATQSGSLLLRPGKIFARIEVENVEPDAFHIQLLAHYPLLPPTFQAIPPDLLGLLATPPPQGLILMAGLSPLLPSIATFFAERYVRMPSGHRLVHTLPGLDLTERFGAHQCLVQYNGLDDTLDVKVRMAMRRHPQTMVLGEPRSAKDVDQVITASMVGHLVYAAHAQGRAVDAVVDWVGKSTQEEQWSRIVDVLSALRLLVGGASVRAQDGNVQWNYEYLPMNEGLVDEMLATIKADQESSNPSPILSSLRNVLETAMEKHGHTWALDITCKPFRSNARPEA